MNIEVLSRILNKCRESSVKGESSHFTFLVTRNKIMSMGKNNTKKTHPRAARLRYWSCGVHSELDAILKFPSAPKKICKSKVVNVRIKKDGSIGMSKPCIHCQKLLKSFGIDEALHTTNSGEITLSSF